MQNELWKQCGLVETLGFFEEVTGPKIWKPGRKSKIKGEIGSEIHNNAQHKGAMLKVKTQHTGAMSLLFLTQHKGAMSGFQLAQHKDATIIFVR